MRRLLPLFFPLLLTACTGENFDEATIPPEQFSTEMAFTRLAKHGEMEPVLDVGQPLENWQFFVAGITPGADGAESTEITLRDRSGIGYVVTPATTPPAIIRQMSAGGYGYGTGEIVSVDRDLAAGKIDVVVGLRSWRPKS